MGGWTEKDRKREHVERDVDDDDGGTCVCPDLASLADRNHCPIPSPFHLIGDPCLGDEDH